MTRLGISAASLLLLAACGSPSGTVIEKHIEPERTYMTTVCIGGKVIVCTPQRRRDDEDHILVIRTESGERKEADVDAATYAATEVGSYYGGDR